MITNHYKKGVGKIKSSLENRFPLLMEKHIMPTNVMLMDRFFLYQSKKKAKKYLSFKSIPLFRTIEIETINRCNGTCSFCPVNKNIDPRPLKLMDKELFTSIIHQLKDMNYSGSVGLYSNNEPLLDKRLFDFLKITRNLLPKNSIYIYTNGSLLTIEKVNKLMKYLDKLIIDNYNDDLVLNNPVKKIHQYIIDENKDYKSKIKIYIRKQNEVLTNRGGQAENRTTNNMKLKSACMFPFEQFVVRPDGKVSLCCNDALGKMTMGDLTTDTILNIWNGKRYNTIRKNMVTNRNLNFLCKDCDSITPKVFADGDVKVNDYLKMLFWSNK